MKKLSGKLTMQLQASTNYKIFADKKKIVFAPQSDYKISHSDTLPLSNGRF